MCSLCLGFANCWTTLANKCSSSSSQLFCALTNEYQNLVSNFVRKRAGDSKCQVNAHMEVSKTKQPCLRTVPFCLLPSEPAISSGLHLWVRPTMTGFSEEPAGGAAGRSARREAGIHHVAEHQPQHQCRVQLAYLRHCAYSFGLLEGKHTVRCLYTTRSPWCQGNGERKTKFFV